MNVYGLETIQIIQVLKNGIEDKRVLTEISKYKVYKLHETCLKEEFPCINRKFLLRQVRQNTFSRSVENNVKSKGGEGLCRTHSIAFLVSGCREPIENQSGTNFADRRHVFGFKDYGERFLQI